MEKEKALKIIFWVSLAGVLFSGVLSYIEIFKGVCPIGACETTIFTLPSCIYGFVIYLAILVISTFGIKNK
jgi:hypothetical protein